MSIGVVGDERPAQRSACPEEVAWGDPTTRLLHHVAIPLRQSMLHERAVRRWTRLTQGAGMSRLVSVHRPGARGLRQQAQIIGYVDDFKLLMVMRLLALPLVLFFKIRRAAPGPSNHCQDRIERGL